MKKRSAQALVTLGMLMIILFFVDRTQGHVAEIETIYIQNDQQNNQQDGELTNVNKVLNNLRVDFIENPKGVDNKAPLFSWEIVDETFMHRQEAYRIVVELGETMGESQILWDSGIVKSNQTTNIKYEGQELQSHSQYTYTIFSMESPTTQEESILSSQGKFTTAYLDEQPFANSKMIKMDEEENVYGDGQAVFVKDFSLQKEKIKRATIYASALGIYDAYINGKRIGKDELKPGWSDFHHDLYYNTYDITDSISESENRIAVMLGTGWWCGRVAFGTYDYKKPGFICEILVEYEDGTKESIITDESWSYIKDTAVEFGDIFNGEVYNMNKPTTRELSLYDRQLSSEVQSKKQAQISDDFQGIYRSFYGTNVTILDEYEQFPKSIMCYDSVSENSTDFGEVMPCYEAKFNEKEEDLGILLKAGETLIVDMGQNMTGVPYLQYSIPLPIRENESGNESGNEPCNEFEITIDFAEMLNDSGELARGNDGPKGSLYTANYRSATSDVIIKDELTNDKINVTEKEATNQIHKREYQSTFSYFGFRYLSITATQDIQIHQVLGKVVSNSASTVGTLTTDNGQLNQLISNIQWTQRNNFLLVATDCPQRDERIGWSGDLQVFAKTSMYNQDLYSFYKKWMSDIRNGQTSEGAYTDTVPATIITGSGNTGWGDAGISVPLDVYDIYADKQSLESFYPSMIRYMDYLESQSNIKVFSHIGAHTVYGDWLGVEDTDKELVSAIYYGKTAKDMAEIALILDNKKDNRAYSKLFKQIKDYFQIHYMENGNLKEEYRTQTSLTLALMYDFVDEKDRMTVVSELATKIEQKEYQITTGFLGTPDILHVLSSNGREQNAYQLLLQEIHPAWLYSINQGATTIWERYDSYTEEKGFADVAMNSFNHFNNGSVLQWMYEDMLGISMGENSGADRKANIVFTPCIPFDFEKGTVFTEQLRSAKGSIHSIYGEIEAAFDIKEKEIIYKITVPVNQNATVILPNAQKSYEVHAGNYTFIYEMKDKTWHM